MTQTFRSSLALLAALLGTTACSSGSEPAKTGSEQGPLYVTATRVFGDNTSVGYLTTFGGKGADTHVDLSRGIEMDDAWVFGKADPYFYTATIFSPTIKRWTLSASGELEEGPTLSFMNQGVSGTYTAASTPLFSKTKSYFVDSDSQQVVIWNPAEMSVIGTIPLDAEVDGDLAPTFEIAVTPQRIFVTVFWDSLASGFTKFGSSTRLIAIDPKTDKVVESSDDTRCQTLSPSGIASDGTAYFAPWDYHAVTRAVFGEGFGVSSCGLRVVPTATSYDASYQLDLSSLVGGRPTGTMRMIGNDDALLHVWHDDLVDATPDNWTDSRFLPGYLWYRWHVGDETATALPDQAPSSEGGEWLTLDDKTYTLSANSEYSETTLVELGDSGELVPGATIEGWTTNVIRIR